MRFFLTCLMLALTVMLSAQLNPKHVYVQEKQDIANTVEIQSVTFPPNITNNGFPDSGRDTIKIEPKNGFPNTYILTFDPLADFVGDTEIKVEYFESGPIPGIPYPNYTTIHYRIKASKVTAVNDYTITPSNSVNLFPLTNDSGTDGALTISKIGFSKGGTATVASNDEIQFSFDTGSTSGQILYFAEDSLGTVGSATINIIKEDDAVVASYDRFVNNKSSEIIELPSSSFTVNTGPNNGSISQINGSHVWTYTPNSNFVGTDIFEFTSPNGGSIEFNVVVVNKNLSNSFVVDDHVYTAVNDPVNFNVFTNDLRSDFNIIDYSSELTYNGNGSFSYTPPADFEGDEVFYYKVFSGIAFHTGQIYVQVNNQAPTSELDFTYEILKNHTLKLNHKSPISSYTFSIATAPDHGSLEILDSTGEVTEECATISGVNTIVYIPDEDYDGTDEFDIEYCTTSGDCEIVKVDVNILDTNYDDCLCINDCVYIGDNNDDGIVSMKDILDIGLNMGNGGLDRSNDFTLMWTGQESDDWGHEQMNTNIDLKCGDSDGDGYIDASDFTAVTDNYGRLHKLVADPVTTLSDVPISFIPQQTEVDSGEWLTIDISVGSLTFPAVDLHGVAFSFTIDPNLIDSSSVVFSLYDDAWIQDDGDLTQSAFIVPQDGQVDVAVSRVTKAVDGLGIIGKLEFIVEDEITGFKDIEALASAVQISMNNIITTNAFGEYVRHADQEGTVRINRELDYSQVDIAETIDVYPNPTFDELTIQSNQFTIDRITLFDGLGRMQSDIQPGTTRQYTLDMTTLPEGMYFILVKSGQGFTTKKVMKINQ